MSTINKGSDYFGVLTYTGDGAASKTIVDTNAVSFTPDFVWIKGRSGTTDHALYDAVRGTTKQLESNTTTAETTETTGLTSFVNGGFTVGNLAQMNTSGATYVAWCWKAGSSTVTNTSGSISSQVRANTTAGFSVATFTAPSSNGNYTVGHGLGVSPSMIIAKTRGTTSNWTVWHIGLTGGASNTTNFIYLNSTAAQGSGTDIWGNSAPNSTTWGVNVGTQWAANSTLVAYCWAEIAGFSRFGSYVGNGSTNGPFIFTNFQPEYVLIKNVTNYDWHIFDATRNSFNLTNSSLKSNTTGAEFTNNDVSVDFVSNGFKLRGTDLAINGNGNTHIYACFASNPFKISNAR